MITHPLPYSVLLFEQLYQDLPPFFPKAEREAMRHALDHIQHDAEITSEEMDTTLIVFGKKIWPYAQAFREFFEQIEKRRADEFFEAHAQHNPALCAWLPEWQESGGHAYELFRGAREHVGHLSPEERGALCEVLVETKRDLKNATAIMVSGPDKEVYQKRVLEFTMVAEAIDERLENLRGLADNEQEHPELAEEIRQSVRDFEKGMAFLKAHTTFEDVCHFESRVPVRRKVMAARFV